MNSAAVIATLILLLNVLIQTLFIRSTRLTVPEQVITESIAGAKGPDGTQGPPGPQGPPGTNGQDFTFSATAVTGTDPVDTSFNFVRATGTVHSIGTGSPNQTLTITNGNPSVLSAFEGTVFDDSVSIVYQASNGDIYVGGNFLNVNNIFLPRVARFRGGAWESIFDNPSNVGLSTTPQAFNEDSVGNVYIGGGFTSVTQRTNQTSAVGCQRIIIISNNPQRTVSLNPFSSNAPPDTVSGIQQAAIGSTLYMVVSINADQINNNIRYFVQPATTPTTPFSTISLINYTSFAQAPTFLAAFTDSGVSTLYVSSITGTTRLFSSTFVIVSPTWTSAATNVENSVFSMILNPFNSSQLLVGGNFNIPPFPLPSARYVGTLSSSPSATNFVTPFGNAESQVRGFLVSQDATNLFMYGDFQIANQRKTLRLARWNSTLSSWVPAGSLVNNAVTSGVRLASTNNTYLIGGNFDVNRGETAYYLQQFAPDNAQAITGNLFYQGRAVNQIIMTRQNQIVQLQFIDSRWVVTSDKILLTE